MSNNTVTRQGEEYEWRDGTWWTVSDQPEPFTWDWELEILGLDPDGPDNADELDQQQASARGEVFGHKFGARSDRTGWQNLGYVSYSASGEVIIRMYESGDEIRVRRSWWPGRCKVTHNGRRVRGPATRGHLAEVETRMITQAGSEQ